MPTVYGVFGGDLDGQQRKILEFLINAEIEKRGLDAEVKVNDSLAIQSSVPAWDTELSDAVDAGIDRYRARVTDIEPYIEP
jgi:hypothetical protein